MSIASELQRIQTAKSDVRQSIYNEFGIAIPESVTLDKYKYYLENNEDYLSFYCDEAGTIGWKCSDASIARTIQYSKDFGATWTNLTSTTGGTTVSVSAGDIVWFKGVNSAYGDSSYYNQFTLSNKAHVYGNVNSLTGNNASVSAYCFKNLFKGCSTLYTYEFKKIILPAITLADGCYYYMFDGCSSLTFAPELPATTLANGCYSYMFNGCTSLTTAPELPATTLMNSCYNRMFQGCTSLNVAPVISATVLATKSCLCMFKDCTSLTEPPELPATTLAQECYGGMFQGCTSLVKAPNLPATVLAQECYNYMFNKCSSLSVAPVISATVLALECCYGMFNKCTSLTEAPELPATTLAEGCYAGMFQYCSSLVKAPELPAVTLVSHCYDWMFFSCSSLNYIKAMFTTTPSDSYTKGWVSGVTATGTFVKNADATWDVTGDNGVPTGWTIDYYHIPKPEAGDIVYYNGNSLKFCKQANWSSGLGTPVAIVVVPKGHTSDNTVRCMSVTGVNADGTSSSTEQSMQWNNSTLDTSLPNFNKVAVWDNYTVGNVTSRSSGCLPTNNSDSFTHFTITCGTDSNVKYDSETVEDGKMVPSPYLEDGSPNQDYRNTVGGTTANCLSDFDGSGNTSVLVGLGASYSAANACYLYSTPGIPAGRWYLPACGEFGYVMVRYLQIKSALTLVGGTLLYGSSDYWTSTEFADYYARVMNIGYASISDASKRNEFYVRAFCSLPDSLGF